MSREEKIQAAFEQIQQEADKRIIHTFYVFLPALFVVGAVYKQPVLALAGCICSAGLLYFAMQYTTTRENRNTVVTIACALGAAFLQIVTKGLSESRYVYFVFLYMLVLYRDRRIIGITTLIVLTYLVVAYTVILTNNPFAEMAKRYLVEAQSVSVERFVFALIFTLVCNLVALVMADVLRRESMQGIESQVSKEWELQNYAQNVAFADEIAAGNLEVAYDAKNVDALGKSLINMRDNLKKADEKDEQDRFISEATAEVGEILRQYTQDLEQLTDQVLSKLIHDLNASQGAIYIVEEIHDEVYLDMIACYAYNRKKYLHHRIYPGQGLIGQAYLEALPTYLTELPKSYQPIDMGMGDTKPHSLFILPLKAGGKVVGILEIASLWLLEGYQKIFLERVADNIAATIITARNNRETQMLYQQSQIATEELRAREEEMRQNMEELKATQEEMQRTQIAMQESQMKSRAIFDGSINSIIIFNEQGWIEEINPSTELMFGYERNNVSNMKIENLFAEFSEGFQNFIGLRSRLTAKKRNGETFPVQSFLNRFLIGSRNILLIYSRDATKDVARENEVQIKIQQLELAKQIAEDQARAAQSREVLLKRELQELKGENK